MRLVENHRGIFGQDRAEIVLANGEIGEKQVVIHDDEVGFLRALVHGGDETLLKFGALLAAAEVAARVDAVPEFRVVGKKRELAAIAGFGQLAPVANLREPVDFVHAFQDGLAFHLMHFLPAQKIGAALHQRRLQVGREVLLQEGNILLEELLLQRFRGGGDHHAPAAANRRNQIGERLAGAGARLDHDMLMVLEGFFDDPRHFELRRAELVAGMTRFEQAPGAKNSIDGDFFGFFRGRFFRHGGAVALSRSAKANIAHAE